MNQFGVNSSLPFKGESVEIFHIKKNEISLHKLQAFLSMKQRGGEVVGVFLNNQIVSVFSLF